MPRFPGSGTAHRSSTVWIVLMLGSGELVWWPYLVAKYGLTFVWMLLPACLLKYPLTVEIGRYTLLTGESVFRGAARTHRGLGVLVWIATAASLLWLGTPGAEAGARIQAFDAAWAGLGDAERARTRAIHLGTRPDHATVAFAKD